MTGNERFYPNYNVRISFIFDLEEGYAWCRGQGIPVRTFVNMDGGGMNYDILEFESLEHVLRFARHFDIDTEDIWVEEARRCTRRLGELELVK